MDDLSAKFHQASLKIQKNSSQPMVTSASLLLEGTTSIPTSSLPIFSVNIPSFRSSHIPFVGSISAPFMRPSMCFSDSICITPLPVVGSVPLLTSSSVCISESAPVCVSAYVPVSVPYVPSLFVSEPIPDLSVTQFSEFHIRDVAQFVDQPGEPVSGFVLSIPMSVTVSAPCVSVSGVSLAGSENMSESAARSSKGKNPLISTSKRKLDDSDEVMFVTETRARKKSTPSVSIKMTRSRTASVLPKSASKSAPASSSKKSKSKSFQPVLLHSGLSEDWKTNWDQSLLFERNIVEDDLITHCNVLSLLRDQNLLHTVQNIGPYSSWLVPEFYTNLQEDADDSSSTHFHEIFIRNKWYSISPTSINKYLNRPSSDYAVTMSLNSVVGILTHNRVVEWPKTGLQSQNLTAVYSVLLRLAATNWLPSVNANLVYENMGFLPYKIRNKLDVDLGSVIFSHIMSFTNWKKEANLIYGVLTAQGFTLYDHEPVLDNEHFYRVDPRLDQGHHHDDRATLTASASASGSSAARSVPLHPPAVVMHRQMACSIEASLALLRTSIVVQQDAVAGLERTLLDHYQEIARLETRHAAILDTQARTADSAGSAFDSNLDGDDSDSGIGSLTAH